MNQEEKILRQYVRKKISKMIREQEEKEFQLRSIIRKLLREGDISDVHPHRSTAINTLEDVLKKAIPTLRKDYKNLTTDKSQRESFRAHILKAMKDVVAKSKNINLTPRQSHNEIETGGLKFKVLGEDASDFKFKIKKKN